MLCVCCARLLGDSTPASQPTIPKTQRFNTPPPPPLVHIRQTATTKNVYLGPPRKRVDRTLPEGTSKAGWLVGERYSDVLSDFRGFPINTLHFAAGTPPNVAWDVGGRLAGGKAVPTEATHSSCPPPLPHATPLPPESAPPPAADPATPPAWLLLALPAAPPRVLPVPDPDLDCLRGGGGRGVGEGARRRAAGAGGARRGAAVFDHGARPR